jgi:hypothetical protein
MEKDKNICLKEDDANVTPQLKTTFILLYNIINLNHPGIGVLILPVQQD